MLEKKQIIIIILIAVIIALAGLVAFTLLNQTQYQTIQISNGTTIDVPKTDDATWSDLGYGIKSYACESKHFVLTSYNSQENSNLVGGLGFALARDMLLNGSTDVENYHGYQIKENTVNDTHFYIVFVGNDTSHDNIIIGSADLNILKHVLDTIHFGKPGEAVQASLGITPTSKPVNHTNKTSSSDNAEFGGYDPVEYYYLLGLADGHEEGYWNGYIDGSSYYDYYDYYDDYYDYYEPTPSPDSGDGGDAAPNVETTPG